MVQETDTIVQPVDIRSATQRPCRIVRRCNSTRQVITPRRIGVWERAGGGKDDGVLEPDTYRDRLLKYIPAETVVIWIAVFGSVSALASGAEFFPLFARWVLVIGTILTWIYLQYGEGVHDGVQLAISSAGFVVWVHAFAVLPFSALPYYNPVLSAILLPVYTALVPLVDGIPKKQCRQGACCGVRSLYMT